MQLLHQRCGTCYTSFDCGPRQNFVKFNCSDGRVARASALGTVHLGLIPSRVKPMTLKLVFTASLPDAQHLRDSVENKPVSLLVVSLGEALSGIPPSWYGR